MAKGQKKNSREAKKPKASKNAAPLSSSQIVPNQTRALPTKGGGKKG